MNDSSLSIPTWYRDPHAEQAMAEGHAPIWRHLLSLVPERELSGVRVLDFGCNQGGFCACCIKFGHLVRDRR